jgi:hypothetical protein
MLHVLENEGGFAPPSFFLPYSGKIVFIERVPGSSLPRGESQLEEK